MAYCLDDGKVDQESEFETELYHSLLKQLEVMKNDISDETLALIWLYLQIFGKPVEPLLLNVLWNFDNENFSRAIKTLTQDQVIENDAVTFAMKQLIVNRLKSHNQCVKEWTNDIYKDILDNFCSKCKAHNCQSCTDSLYIIIEFGNEQSVWRRLSGNYTFHSVEKSALGSFPIYNREYSIPGYSQFKIFLRRKKDYWCIFFEQATYRSIANQSEILKISTTGDLFHSHIIWPIYNCWVMLNLEANPFKLDDRWDAFKGGFKIPYGPAIIKIYGSPQKNDKVTDILLYS